MKTLILFATRYGCTKRCAEMLAGKIRGKVEVRDLANDKKADIDNYELVIIGGSIMAGKMNKLVTRFVDDNLQKLLSKKVALFICCLQEGETAKEQFNNAFPKQLQDRAIGRGYFGGEVDFSKLNFFLKGLMKKILETDKSVSRISVKNIDAFALYVNNKGG
ncbi:MAG: flavodoxin domain-containing protein [Actinomycetota bacterium]